MPVTESKFARQNSEIPGGNWKGERELRQGEKGKSNIIGGKVH